jgi:DNA repair exonuclease SbcCD ATPase subunit
MKINSVEIENFLSIKKDKVNFDSFKGLVQVKGKNKDTKPFSSNGAGKSALIEAVVFALFGKTIRKTTEKSVTHVQSKEACKVVLKVNNNVTVTRTKKPPSLIVDVGGTNCTKEGIQQTQQYLEETLNTNYNIFLASIVFGQQNGVNFLSSTPDEKRSIIQNFLNVTDLFRYRSKIRSLKSGFNSDKKVAGTLQSESLQKANKLKKKIKNLKSEIKSAEDILEKEKKDFIDKYSLSQIQELESKRLELELLESSLAGKLVRIEDTIDRLKKDIIYYKENSSCEHCNKLPLAMYNKLKSSEEDLEKAYQERIEVRSELKKSSPKLQGFHIPITAGDYELIGNIGKLATEVEVLSKQLRAQQRLSKKYSSQMEDAQKKYDLLRFWETAFSEQGLVKYIIRNILDYFNDRSNYYLNVLTKGGFTIKFNDALEETIKNKRKLVFYDALSGGEKKKVSLSVMLALNDLLVLSGKEKSNLLFFDEVADSLDREGVKGLCDLIDEVAEGKKLFIITHNDYLTSLIEDKADTLSVTKKQGITSFNRGG